MNTVVLLGRPVAWLEILRTEVSVIEGPDALQVNVAVPGKDRLTGVCSSGGRGARVCDVRRPRGPALVVVRLVSMIQGTAVLSVASESGPTPATQYIPGRRLHA